MQQVRTLRLLEFEGDKDWVEQAIFISIHVTKKVSNNYGYGTIKAQTIESFTTVSEKPKKEPLKTPLLLPNYCPSCGFRLIGPGIYVRCDNLMQGPYLCPKCGYEIYKGDWKCQA